jgi:heme oxygenase
MSDVTLSQKLADATRGIHRTAERTALMTALIKGTLALGKYCVLLRNLHSLYDAMETAIDRRASLPVVAPIRMPDLYRAAALRKDLALLQGPGWPALPVARSMQRYVARIGELARGRPQLLAAHAYVRYLGDLSGGQVLRTIIARTYDLPGDNGTAFYDFGAAVDVVAAKEAFRAGLDALPLVAADTAAMATEAVAGFVMHVEIFAELDSMDVISA